MPTCRSRLLRYAALLACASMLLAAIPSIAQESPIALFNGRNLDGWTIFTPDKDLPTSNNLF